MGADDELSKSNNIVYDNRKDGGNEGKVDGVKMRARRVRMKMKRWGRRWSASQTLAATA